MDTIGTEHLLLGLLSEGKSNASELLNQRGVHLETTREALIRTRHDDSEREVFARESVSLPEVVEMRAQIKVSTNAMIDALTNHDRAMASKLADEERTMRGKFYLLCRQHGTSDWLFD